MRKIVFIPITLILLFCLVTACKKVIHIDLNTASPKIVIEGNIYDRAGPFAVKIFKSVNFDASNVYPPVSGAIVKISDTSGYSDVLTEKLPGLYVTSFIMGIPGETYTLTVNAEGQTYTASSTMPEPVDIGKVYFQNSFFGNTIYPGVNFVDPPNINNYYRLLYSVNNAPNSEINVTDDRLSEGKTITYLIRPADTDVKLKAGDNVTVWLESIDQGVYEYFRTAGREGGQSASPANPTSNISNGALGYFNACSLRARSAIVP